MAEPTGIHVDVAGYALGQLETEERSRFEQHLADCGSCQGELTELEGAARLLALVAPADQPPPGLAARTLLAVEREAGTPGQAREREAAAGLRARGGRRRRGDRGDPRRPAGTRHGHARARRAATLRSPSQPGVQGTVQVTETGIGRVVEVESRDLPVLTTTASSTSCGSSPPTTRRLPESRLRGNVPPGRVRHHLGPPRRRRRPRELPGGRRHPRAPRRRPAGHGPRGPSVQPGRQPAVRQRAVDQQRDRASNTVVLAFGGEPSAQVVAPVRWRRARADAAAVADDDPRAALGEQLVDRSRDARRERRPRTRRRAPAAARRASSSARALGVDLGGRAPRPRADVDLPPARVEARRPEAEQLGRLARAREVAADHPLVGHAVERARSAPAPARGRARRAGGRAAPAGAPRRSRSTRRGGRGSGGGGIGSPAPCSRKSWSPTAARSRCA